MLLFGGVQVVMSQIPDFHNMEWLSVVAAIMSFTYSFIGFGLGFAQVIGMITWETCFLIFFVCVYLFKLLIINNLNFTFLNK